jgi:hypothetical protein
VLGRGGTVGLALLGRTTRAAGWYSNGFKGGGRSMSCGNEGIGARNIAASSSSRDNAGGSGWGGGTGGAARTPAASRNLCNKRSSSAV